MVVGTPHRATATGVPHLNVRALLVAAAARVHAAECCLVVRRVHCVLVCAQRFWAACHGTSAASSDLHFCCGDTLWPGFVLTGRPRRFGSIDHGIALAAAADDETKCYGRYARDSFLHTLVRRIVGTHRAPDL